MAVTFVVCFILLFASCSKGQYENCSTNRTVLENAFFETGTNLNELDHVFFPLRTESSKFAIVNYTFLDANGIADDNCTVTYIWAVGDALFLQPPQIFQLTSLLFSNPANDLKKLSLQLPYHCQQLVSTDKGCSCRKNFWKESGSNPGSNPLDIFTQQVN